MQTGQWGRRGWCDGEGGFITTHIEDECGNNIPQFDVRFEIEKSSNKKTDANCQEKDDRWRKIQMELKIHLMSSDLLDERAKHGHTHTYLHVYVTNRGLSSFTSQERT